MANIWDSVKGVAKATGSAFYAPVGAVVDLAQMPFDDKDDDFGTALGALSDRSADFLELFMGNTVTGKGAESALKGMDWLLDNGLNRPMSTLATATSASTAGHDLFDRETWSKAYQASDNMNFGQAFANLLLYKGDELDPLSYDNAYDERTSQEMPKQAAGISWGSNIAGILVADPAAVALKGAGFGINAYKYAQMSAAERANFGKILSGEVGGKGANSLQSRVDKWLDWTEGSNKLKRPMTAPEILAGTPELRRYGSTPTSSPVCSMRPTALPTSLGAVTPSAASLRWLLATAPSWIACARRHPRCRRWPTR